jgi:hypothetical protein
VNGNEPLFAIVIILAIAAYIQAYNWGWQAGHDVHHEEPNNGPRNEKPPEPRMWV